MPLLLVRLEDEVPFTQGDFLERSEKTFLYRHWRALGSPEWSCASCRGRPGNEGEVGLERGVSPWTHISFYYDNPEMAFTISNVRDFFYAETSEVPKARCERTACPNHLSQHPASRRIRCLPGDGSKSSRNDRKVSHLWTTLRSEAVLVLLLLACLIFLRTLHVDYTQTLVCR